MEKEFVAIINLHKNDETYLTDLDNVIDLLVDIRNNNLYAKICLKIKTEYLDMSQQEQHFFNEYCKNIIRLKNYDTEFDGEIEYECSYMINNTEIGQYGLTTSDAVEIYVDGCFLFDIENSNNDNENIFYDKEKTTEFYNESNAAKNGLTKHRFYILLFRLLFEVADDNGYVVNDLDKYIIKHIE